ncbi:MAG: arylsulfatase [Cytophagaceae bacterium]|nr:arylsulfatase [Cytophagaceae bacterium]
MKKLLLGTALLLLLGTQVSAQNRQATRRATDRRNAASPNIIYILADDLGYGNLTCYNPGGRVPTPHLDAMAKQGTRFTRFYAGSTVCAPSRCALMTGKHMGHAYVRGNGEIPLRTQDTTLAKRLKANGYATGMFGKWGLGTQDSPGAPQVKGWDEFLGYLDHRHAHNYHTDHLWQVRKGTLSKLPLDSATYTHDLIVGRAMEFIQENRDKPFFLYLPMTLVHAELGTTTADLKPFLNAEGKSRFGAEKPYFKQRPPSLYATQTQPHAAFAAMLTRLDSDVGNLLDLLKKLGLDENTYVVFTSDNGPHKEGGADPEFFDSNGPLRGIKRDLYEGGIRVPMLVRGPGVPAGKVNDTPWANWDILPTACALTGAPVPGGIDGQSMTGVLRGGSSAAGLQRPLFWQFNEGELRQAVVLGDWKLIRFKKASQPERLELYDLSQDEGETNDLAARHPERVVGLRKSMNEAQQPAEHPLFDWRKEEL